MALALVEEDWGRRVADSAAARLVVYARRPGFQAQFSETLIACRFGLTDRQLQFPEGEPHEAPVSTGASMFMAVRSGWDRRRRALEGMRYDLPWLDVSRQQVYEVQCGPRLMEIAIADPFNDAGAASSTLAERPALPAVVAFQSPEHDDFYAALLVLSRPSGNGGVAIAVTRLTGDTVYTAEGFPDQGLGVELRSTRSPGIAAATARVQVNSSGVLIAGLSERRAAPGREPGRATESS